MCQPTCTTSSVIICLLDTDVSTYIFSLHTSLRLQWSDITPIPQIQTVVRTAMKHNYHLIKGSTNIPVSMATSILVHRTGQGLFFALMAGGKAWPPPPFFTLPTENSPYLVLLSALCLGIMWQREGMGQKCAKEVAINWTGQTTARKCSNSLPCSSFVNEYGCGPWSHISK